MSSAVLQTRIYLRHRGLVFWSFFVPVFFLMPLATMAHVQDRGAAAMTLFTLAGLTMSAAFFVASAQQELLSKSMCFLMPGLREGMLRNQGAITVLMAGLGLAAAFLVPALTDIIQGRVTQALSVAFMMVVVFDLTLLVVFQFNYSSWLPFQVIWILSLGLKYLMRVSPQQVEILLDQTVLWGFAAGLVGFLVAQQIQSRAMHRKLTQRPYISLADVRNPQRVEAFKRARNLHKVQKSEGLRPLDGLLQALNRQIAALRSTGNHTRALVWEALYLSLATTIPRAWKWIVLIPAAFLAAMIVTGYYDSLTVMKDSPDFLGWFSGLLYMAVTSVALLAYHLRVRTVGRLASRRDRLRAGWVGTAVMTVGGLVLSLLMFGMAHLLAAVLPQFTLGDHIYFIVTPGAHVLGLVLFVLPVQLLTFCLWRAPRSPMVLQQAGTLAFFVYHGTFNFFGTENTCLALGVLSVGLWIALTLAWRWRVLSRDQV